jgi:hypothetical protein
MSQEYEQVQNPILNEEFDSLVEQEFLELSKIISTHVFIM